MTVREDLLAAARQLAGRGIVEFSPAQLIAEAQELGCPNPVSTLRTQIIHGLRVDEGRVRSGEGFSKVGPGVYRVATAGAVIIEPRSPALTPPPPTQVPPVPADDWYWEGNVQAAVVRMLATDRWAILRVASTASREHGVDIEAKRDDITLLVEVKGYPSTVYRTGEKVGQAKSGGLGAQARTYFGNAVLTGLLMRSDNPAARVVLAFPELETFRTLAERTAGPLSKSAIEVWLVGEAGHVRGVS